MVCRNCGKEVEGYSGICMDCGEPVNEYFNKVRDQKEKPNKMNKLVFWILCGMGILTVVYFIYVIQMLSNQAFYKM